MFSASKEEYLKEEARLKRLQARKRNTCQKPH
jgi:hypothetical protein